MSDGFRQLEVYRWAAELSDELQAAIKGWPAADLWTLGVQLIRAADSVGANIAEASGRGTHQDRRRFLFIARGSAYELQHWLERTERRCLPHPPEARARAESVSRMLNALIKSRG